MSTMNVEAIAASSNLFTRLSDPLHDSLEQMLVLVAAGKVGDRITIAMVCSTGRCTGGPASVLINILRELKVVVAEAKGSDCKISDPGRAATFLGISTESSVNNGAASHTNNGDRAGAAPPTNNAPPPQANSPAHTNAANPPPDPTLRGDRCEACNAEEARPGRRVGNKCARNNGRFYQWRWRNGKLPDTPDTESQFLDREPGHRAARRKSETQHSAPINIEGLIDALVRIADFLGINTLNGQAVAAAAKLAGEHGNIEQELAAAKLQIQELQRSAQYVAMERERLQANDALWRHVEKLVSTRRIPPQG